MKMTFSQRQKKFPLPPKLLLRKLIRNAVKSCGLELGPYETVSVAFLGPAAMARANRDFLGHNGPTDVISFHYPPDPGDTGEEPSVSIEILLCPEIAWREAVRRRLPYGRELVLYLVHGLLHAAGEEDETPECRRRMRRRERAVMKKLAATFDLDGFFPK
jgi:probable rRNA maturation factor